MTKRDRVYGLSAPRITLQRYGNSYWTTLLLHWKLVPTSRAAVVQECQDLHLEGQKVLGKRACQASAWTENSLPYMKNTIKSKCFDTSPSDTRRTCRKQGTLASERLCHGPGTLAELPSDSPPVQVKSFCDTSVWAGKPNHRRLLDTTSAPAGAVAGKTPCHRPLWLPRASLQTMRCRH